MMTQGKTMKDLLRLYLESSREFSAQLAERTPGEVAYDGDVLAGLRQGLPIRGALDRAAQKHPQEALQADDAVLEDMREHYEYLKNHEDILAKFRGVRGAPNGGKRGRARG